MPCGAQSLRLLKQIAILALTLIASFLWRQINNALAFLARDPRSPARAITPSL